MVYKYLLIGLLLAGCRVSYSFKGISISSDVKTITIDEFYNNVSLGPSDIANVFSESLRDYFQRNSPLSLTTSEGDLYLTGKISDYDISPVSAAASGTQNGIDYAALTRITITVVASYENKLDHTFDFENKSFSFFKDFDQNRQNIQDNEREFVEEIFERLIQDIYTASLANW